GPTLVSSIGLAMLAVALVCFWTGPSTLWLVLIGVALVPIALQYNQVPLQATALSVDPQASGRLNTAFMVTSFVGGAIGSEVAGALIEPLGWTAICVEATVFFLACLVLFCTRPGRSDVRHDPTPAVALT
ncbi:MAG: hypothetical protein FWF75_09815, partial [Propionibacteriaceae bacterium]|nr:hypothetical protein [Propionibacteriaceae bacterium]